ncbi:hypothetical protein [Syntrophaceticus schinkii]|jgi:hypothetical protein|uniref:Uncharacterized protein n=1 Tax=Syntrophaceticus schinkii TaxID=499207 RepID=A0A0B7MCV5_9FIRM|nr:hypothetical protein [Syntrophaceticus schinkii]MDD2359910.1 hypothetical protein [Syntrophaceticus schinkii]MDD4261105.1 hypothetical protein [Syntrophaceticus schinkii]MDD4674521.1 hypothetical protein [Syntrophaceticus schinkii]CEO87905.1 exported hypothetical protein [Syntrophaceticus schinkii]
MRKLLSVLLMVFFLGVMAVQIVDAKPSVGDLKIKNIGGEILQQGKGIQKGSDILLNDLQIAQENGVIKGKGNIVCNGVETSLELHGKLYPVRGKGYYAGKLVLGDIEATEDYNVLKFKIENKVSDSAHDQYDNGGSTLLSIVLEDRESGEWVRFQQGIDQQIFEIFYKGSNELVANLDMDEDELIEKVVHLLNMHNKAEHGEQIQDSIKVVETGTADTDGNFTVDSPITIQSWTDIPVNFNELDRLFEDLKDPYTNSVNLLDYNLPESLFKGSGWKKDVDIETSPRWNYYARSAQQDGYTITQITAFQHDSRFLDEEGNYFDFDFDIVFWYKHGMIVEYNHYTRAIKVMYYDWGLTLRELQIVQGALEDRNVYIAQTLSGDKLTKRNNDWISYFVTLIPHGDIIVDLWAALTPHSTNDPLGQRVAFIGSNYEEQNEMHGGKVYRSVSGALTQWDLRIEGANTNFVGEINSGDGYVSLMWGYETTVGSNL